MLTSKVTSLLILAVIALFFVVSDVNLLPSPRTMTSSTIGIDLAFAGANTKREPRFGDGCLLVFLDIGANLGVHTRFLFEPKIYPGAGHVQQRFNQHFGLHRDNRDICSFGFEPNPTHLAHHKELEQHYQNMGWRYKHIPAGASDHDGNLTFWHQGDTNREEWGFTMHKRNDTNVPEVVPLVRLAKWIQYHITERELPETFYGNYSNDHSSTTVTRGKVVMKLDIEGSEVYVLPDMFYSGVFCSSIDYCFGEYHGFMFKELNQALASGDNVREGLQFRDWNDLQEYLNTLSFKALKSQRKDNCRGYFEYFDSEAYLHDGMPWPDEEGYGVAPA